MRRSHWIWSCTHRVDWSWLQPRSRALISKRKGKVTVFVPHFAMSGGTLIALAADEIVMCAHAVLGPVDPQLGEYPAASIVKAARQKPIAEVDDKTLILADQAEKAIFQMEHEVTDLLGRKVPAEKATELAKLLTSGTWTHDLSDYLRARTGAGSTCPQDDMPENILRLMQLYPQPIRRQPSVEYLPLPYRTGEPGPRKSISCWPGRRISGRGFSGVLQRLRRAAWLDRVSPCQRVLAKISLLGRRSAEPQQVQHFVKYLRSSQDYRAGSAVNGGADWVGAGAEVLVRRSLNHMITT